MTTGYLKHQLTAGDFAFCHSVVCAGFHAAKYHTVQVVEEILTADIPGDFAEAGVLYGAQPAVMLYVLKKWGVRTRKVHLFDSFQGIPHATADDPEWQQAVYGMSKGKMESSGVSACSVDQVVANLRNWGVYDPALVEIHPGWFQDTMDSRAAQSIGRLALLRVDVDLYESTKAVYRGLYDKVSHGGFIVDDDWGSPAEVTACRRAVLEIVPNKHLDVVRHVEGQDTTAFWRKP